MTDEAQRTLLITALDACRQELVSRLAEKNKPTSIAISRLVVTDDPAGNGYTTGYEEVAVSSLHEPSIDLAMRIPSGPLDAWGLHHHLTDLATHLDLTTDIGSRSSPFLPAATGPEAIADRYLSPLAAHYLRELSDIDRADDALVGRLADDLERFCEAEQAVIVDQLAISGLRPDDVLAYRDVELRPLSSAERGAVAGIDLTSMEQRTVTSTDFVVPRRFMTLMPSAAIELTSERPWDWASRAHSSTMAHRIVLALFLLGYDIGTREVIATFQRPRWAGFGTSSQVFPVSEGTGGPDRVIDQNDFERVVDLAYRIPEFGAEEGNRREVALYRVFRGCGVARGQSGLLDFAIALEAALLDQTNQELAYKFRLYGALFLRNVRSPQDTFKDLKSIYDARSKLVHGGNLRSSVRRTAERQAKDLARSVVLEAIESGWPDPAELDRLALTVHNFTATSVTDL